MIEHPGHPPRLQSWDYAQCAAYFVTFAVAERRRVLASIENDGTVLLSRSGQIVDECCRNLPVEFAVALDTLVIMPDHVHAILFLDPGAQVDDRKRPSGWAPMMTDPAPVLGKVIRAWKARATRLIRTEEDPAFAWQSRFYERIVRGESGLHRVRAYIEDNPRRWRGR
jgi:putative transposase